MIDVARAQIWRRFALLLRTRTFGRWTGSRVRAIAPWLAHWPDTEIEEAELSLERVGEVQSQSVDVSCVDNKIVVFFLWLFQNLFHPRARWTECYKRGKQKPRVCGAFVKAL
jgi:hypothetical protein